MIIHLVKAQTESEWEEIISHDKYIDQLLMDREIVDEGRIIDIFGTAYRNLIDKSPTGKYANGLINDTTEKYVNGLINIDLRRARLFKSLNAWGCEANTFVEIGFACIGIDRFKLARACFEKARMVSTRSFLLKAEVESMVGLAIVCLETGVATSVAGATRHDGLNMLRSAICASTLITDKSRVQQLYAHRSLLHYLLQSEDTLDEALEEAAIFHALASQTSIDLDELIVTEVHAYIIMARVYHLQYNHEKFQEIVVEMLGKMREGRTTTKFVADEMLLALNAYGGVIYEAVTVSRLIPTETRKQWDTEVCALRTIAGVT